MTLLLSASILIVLLLITLVSITNAQRKRTRLIEEAKLRAELRKTSKDVWQANVPTQTVVHILEPIDYDTTIQVQDDMSDSEYEILKAIFAEADPGSRSNAEKTKVEIDHWADTDHLGILHE